MVITDELVTRSSHAEISTFQPNVEISTKLQQTKSQLETSTLKYTVFQKTTIHLTIHQTSTYLDRFSKFFHCQIPKKTSCNYYSVFHFTLTM